MRSNIMCLWLEIGVIEHLHAVRINVALLYWRVRGGYIHWAVSRWSAVDGFGLRFVFRPDGYRWPGLRLDRSLIRPLRLALIWPRFCRPGLVRARLWGLTSWPRFWSRVRAVVLIGQWRHVRSLDRWLGMIGVAYLPTVQSDGAQPRHFVKHVVLDEEAHGYCWAGMDLHLRVFYLEVYVVCGGDVSNPVLEKLFVL